MKIKSKRKLGHKATQKIGWCDDCDTPIIDNGIHETHGQKSRLE